MSLIGLKLDFCIDGGKMVRTGGLESGKREWEREDRSRRVGK
jgi:hypothetical protein